MDIRQMLPIISVKNKKFVKCPDIKEKYISQLEKFKVKKKVSKKKLIKKYILVRNIPIHILFHTMS